MVLSLIMWHYVKCDRLSGQLHILLHPSVSHLFILKSIQSMFCQLPVLFWVRRFRKVFQGRFQKYVKDCSGGETWVHVGQISEVLIQGCLFCGSHFLIMNAPLLAWALEIMLLSSLLGIRMSDFAVLSHWLSSLAAPLCLRMLCREYQCWQSLN